jgi:hypothetical protein
MKFDGFCCIAHPTMVYFQRLEENNSEDYEKVKSKKSV